VDHNIETMAIPALRFKAFKARARLAKARTIKP
jgi:hypothetical protein